MPFRNRRNSGYSRHSLSIRKELVNLIFNEKLTYAKASKILNLKLSTAKLIVKRYKETGTFFDPFEHKGTPVASPRPQNQPLEAEVERNISNTHQIRTETFHNNEIQAKSMILGPTGGIR